MRQVALWGSSSHNETEAEAAQILARLAAHPDTARLQERPELRRRFDASLGGARVELLVAFSQGLSKAGSGKAAQDFLRFRQGMAAQGQSLEQLAEALERLFSGRGQVLSGVREPGAGEPGDGRLPLLSSQGGPAPGLALVSGLADNASSLLRRMEAVLAEAGSLDVFLAAPALVDRFYEAARDYFGVAKFPRRSFDVIIAQVREAAAKAPELKKKLWRRISPQEKGFAIPLRPAANPVELDVEEWSSFLAGWTKELAKKAAPFLAIADDKARHGEIERLLAQTQARIDAKLAAGGGGDAQGFFAALKKDPRLLAAGAYLLYRKLTSEETLDLLHSGDADLVLETLSRLRNDPASSAWAVPVTKRLLDFVRLAFPDKEALEKNGELFVPVKEGVLKKGGLLAVVPVRPFIALFRGIWLGECTSGGPKYLDSAHPQRYAAPALEGAITHFLELRETGGGQGPAAPYQGFVEYVPVDLKGRRYASTVFGAPILRHKTMVDGRGAAVFSLYVHEAARTRPADWQGFLMGEDTSFNNAGVQALAHGSLQYALGETPGLSEEVSHADPLAGVIPWLRPRLGYSAAYGQNMITGATIPQAQRLTVLADIDPLKAEQPAFVKEQVLRALGEVSDLFKLEKLLALIETRSLKKDPAVLAVLEALLSRSQPELRLGAAEALLDQAPGHAAAQGVVLQALDSQDPSLNAKALEVIEGGDLEAGPLLAAFASHPAIQVRRGLGKILGSHPPYYRANKVRAALEKAVADRDGGVRLAAAQGLLQDEKPHAAASQVLLAAMGDPEETVRLEALEWLTDGNRGLYFRNPEIVQGFAAVLVGEGFPRARARVLEWLGNHDSFDSRVPEFEVAKRRAFPYIAATYSRLLEDPDVLIRTRAAKGLWRYQIYREHAAKRFQDPRMDRALALLLEALKLDASDDQEWNALNDADHALQEIFSQREDRERALAPVRRAIARSLVAALGAKALPVAWIRGRAAMRAAWGLPDDAGLRALLLDLATRDPAEEVRVEAAGLYLERGGEAAEDLPVFASLLEGLSSDHSSARTHAAIRITMLKPRSDLYLERMMQFFESVTLADVRHMLAQEIFWAQSRDSRFKDRLAPYLKDEDPFVRNIIARGFLMQETSPHKPAAFAATLEMLEKAGSLDEETGSSLVFSAADNLAIALERSPDAIPRDAAGLRRLARLLFHKELDNSGLSDARLRLVGFLARALEGEAERDPKVLAALKAARSDADPEVAKAARRACAGL